MKNFKNYSARFALIKEYTPRLLLGAVVMLVTVVIQLSFPKAVSYFIDNASSQHTSKWYITFAAIMSLVLVIQAIATACRYYIFESTGHLLVIKLRRMLFEALIYQPISFFDKHSYNELSSRLSADVEMLKDTLTMSLAIALRSALVALGSIIALFILSPVLSALLLVFVPAALFLGRWIGEQIDKRFEQKQHRLAKCNKVSLELLGNVRLVQAFNQQKLAEGKYQTITDSLLSKSLECTKFLALFQGGSTLLAYFALLMALVVGGLMILNGSLTIGELSSFILYAVMATTSVTGITDFWSEWKAGVGATKEVFSILDCKEQKEHTVSFPKVKGAIKFDQVSFFYPQRANQVVLENVEFMIKPGEVVGVVGASGSGKSTLINLLLGHYFPASGKIFVDDVQLTPQSRSFIRSQVATVEQEPSLFSGTIYDNIAFGIEAEKVTVEAVIAAAKQAHAHEFIDSLPDKYQTLVGDHGVQLSGGQKQRVAIARAILRNPRILLLDEATSALDSANEYLVQVALAKLMQGRTCIVIAHRLKTLQNVDRVLQIENCQITEQRSYQDRMQRTGNTNPQHNENSDKNAPKLISA